MATPVNSPPCYAGLDSDDIDSTYLWKTETPMLNIKSANTIIYCQNWNATRHFYSDILKLEIRFQKDNWFIEYRINDQACLSIADSARCTIEPAHGKGLTLSFFIDDLDKLHRYFESQKVEATPITTNSWRAPFFFVRDPENNRIEFWTMELESQS